MSKKDEGRRVNEKSLRHFINEEFRMLIFPLIMLVLGVFFIVNPGAVIKIAVLIIGVGLLVAGIVFAIMAYKDHSIFKIIGAVVFIVTGRVSVLVPTAVAYFVVKLFGIMILVNSIIHIIEVKRLRGESKILPYIVTDIVTILIGAVLVFTPFTVPTIMLIIIGVFMVIISILDMINAYAVFRNGKYVNDGNVVWEE